VSSRPNSEIFSKILKLSQRYIVLPNSFRFIGHPIIKTTASLIGNIDYRKADYILFFLINNRSLSRDDQQYVTSKISDFAADAYSLSF
jgi:hypothetical protein